MNNELKQIVDRLKFLALTQALSTSDQDAILEAVEILEETVAAQE